MPDGPRFTPMFDGRCGGFEGQLPPGVSGMIGTKNNSDQIPSLSRPRVRGLNRLNPPPRGMKTHLVVYGDVVVHLSSKHKTSE